ncbi:MAG: hypothetical protein JWM11_117 [Planctomycetaceae bacterium]|nr:hypothetical protein [Planctomycetaceae bacterium]
MADRFRVSLPSRLNSNEISFSGTCQNNPASVGRKANGFCDRTSVSDELEHAVTDFLQVQSGHPEPSIYYPACAEMLSRNSRD